MEETEISHFLHILVRMGEALQNSGAEVFRVEDTLNRIAIAYGAEDVNVFVITSSIVVTLTMPSLPPQTETRRLRHAHDVPCARHSAAERVHTPLGVDGEFVRVGKHTAVSAQRLLP